MSNVGHYGRTENIGGRDLATASSLVGTPVGAALGNSTVGSPATMSTAPYIPPKAKAAPPPNGDPHLCYVPGCRGFRVTDSQFCRHHPDGVRAKSKAKPQCSKPGCRGWCKGETEFCRHHQDWTPE